MALKLEPPDEKLMPLKAITVTFHCRFDIIAAFKQLS
ncbi:hypothetical protein M7I_4440 [Glarea lozoyensis 74030]|uniref:Uncharacterized protein n=1 Tax=Glarea lozoyensis (strain ATCC 74030 / MF5533) TaxID=1104152 RepID=H0EP70_GLAL7|nr:hypothetical protein M7I_4440 [Glarea lozoyensis 74030]